MGGRDHSCEVCGHGGFNDPTGVCECAPIDRLLAQEVEWVELPTPEIAEGLYATHEGVLEIGPIRLRCFTLNDGQRVFDVDDLAAVFGGGT